MFTGIITEMGTVVTARSSRVAIRAKRTLLRRLKRGDSIAVEGACLTVISKSRDSFSADLMEETARLTTLGNIRRGTVVNLELPATPASFLSGHIVQGHIDCIGKLVSIKREGNSRMLKFSIPRALSKYVIEKGSIAVNGVALTVVGAKAGHFTVGIIPHTWENTSLRFLGVGAKVNIEVDVLAKYGYSGFVNPNLRNLDLRNPNIGNLKKKPKDIRIGIIGSSFREEVTGELEKRCVATLVRAGVPRGNIDVFRVPGSMEIPLVAKKLAKKRVYDALITFGAIVKGKTYHFEQIANECARGCMQVSLEYEIPVIFEVLAVYDLKDALERATRRQENKGVEAARTALAMIELMSKL